MEWLGHRQIMTTQQYIHTLPDADRRALDASQGPAEATSEQGSPRPERQQSLVSGQRHSAHCDAGASRGGRRLTEGPDGRGQLMVPGGVTHWLGWPVTAAMRSKSVS